MSILRTAIACGAVLAAVSLPACGGGGEVGTGGSSTTSSSSTGAGGAFVTADHAPSPQVITFGGPVLKTPKIQAIVYASDPHAADIDAFLAEMAKTTYWAEATA